MVEVAKKINRRDRETYLDVREKLECLNMNLIVLITTLLRDGVMLIENYNVISELVKTL